jgi:hypothetical protein
MQRNWGIINEGCTTGAMSGRKGQALAIMKTISLKFETRSIIVALAACLFGLLRLSGLIRLSDHDETAIWFLFSLSPSLPTRGG